MRRTALALIALCTLNACTERSFTTSPSTGRIEAPPAPANHQSVRGILRSTEEGWVIEVLDGYSVRLIGGPVETYPALEGKEVVAIGVYTDGSLIVDSCAERTTELDRPT